MQSQMTNIKNVLPTALPLLIKHAIKVKSSIIQKTPTKKGNIDSNICELSSVKLLSILRLQLIDGCQLEESFIIEVKNELQTRGDNQQWYLPH